MTPQSMSAQLWGCAAAAPAPAPRGAAPGPPQPCPALPCPPTGRVSPWPSRQISKQGVGSAGNKCQSKLLVTSAWFGIFWGFFFFVFPKTSATLQRSYTKPREKLSLQHKGLHQICLLGLLTYSYLPFVQPVSFSLSEANLPNHMLH